MKTMIASHDDLDEALRTLACNGDDDAYEFYISRTKSERESWIANIVRSRFHSKLANRVIDFAHAKNRLKGIA